MSVKADLSDAFDSLIDALGETVFVSGKKHQGIVEEVASAEIAIGGGQAESEQFRIKLRKRKFSSLPSKGDLVKVRGRELEIVGPVVDRNDIEYEITVGDLTSGER